MASSPLYFHPETEKILQYLSENATGKSLNEIPLDLIRHGHDLKAHDLSTCDDISFDVSRTEQVIPSPHDPSKPVFVFCGLNEFMTLCRQSKRSIIRPNN